MATLYLARDLKHDRGVALKVMRAELANELGVDRFVREIRLAPVAAAIGKTDEAFDRLDRAYEERDARLIFAGVRLDFDLRRTNMMQRMGWVRTDRAEGDG